MKAAKGHVFKYGDNVDTDVIIPARYLNSSDPKELALHCMEDIDKDFVKNVKAGDIIKQVSAIAGGSGGGKPDSAMGGGKDMLKLDDALASVDDFVAVKLGL